MVLSGKTCLIIGLNDSYRYIKIWNYATLAESLQHAVQSSDF